MGCHTCSEKCHSSSPSSKGNWFNFFKRKEAKPTAKSTAVIALVGSPNVGKSSLFNVLTGTYVTVSNYPGTTVEVSRGKAVISGQTVTIIDTPGMYSLLPITEEERVSRDLLLKENINLIVHVVEAKNLGRMLALTFQLIESRLPVVLAVNMIDEAKKLGLQLDREKLEKTLSIPVVLMAAAHKIGIQELKEEVAYYV